MNLKCNNDILIPRVCVTFWLIEYGGTGQRLEEIILRNQRLDYNKGSMKTTKKNAKLKAT